MDDPNSFVCPGTAPCTNELVAYNYGFTGFKHIGSAMLSFFQAALLDEWCSIGRYFPFSPVPFPPLPPFYHPFFFVSASFHILRLKERGGVGCDAARPTTSFLSLLDHGSIRGHHNRNACEQSRNPLPPSSSPINLCSKTLRGGLMFFPAFFFFENVFLN